MKSLGGLIVTLGLNASEYFSGLTASERAAKRFAATLDRSIADAARSTAIALTAVSAAGAAAFAFLNKQANDIAAFKQLSEQIGDTSNAIAGLQSTSATSGVAMNEIAAASVRLTAALAKTDDEGTQAGKAIKALGIDLGQFKKLAPVAQLEETARALAKFEDGAGKTAVAVAAFGKSGAQLIPFLNDLAEAGGRNERLTGAQIEAADKFTKQLSRLTEEARLFAQILASDAIPTATRFIGEMTEGIRIAGGFGSALRIFGLGISPFRDLSENIRETTKQLEQLEAQSKKNFGPLKGVSDFRDLVTPGAIDDAKRKLEFLKFQQRQAALALISPSNRDARDIRAQALPRLDFNAGAADKAAKALNVATSEAQRYLESLQKQVDKTLELTAVETARLEIQRGLKGVSPQIEKQILALAAEIDAHAALKKSMEEETKAFEEATRAMEQANRERENVTKAAFAEADSIQEANRNLRDEIAIIEGGEAARNAIDKARVSSAIHIKEEALALAQLDAARSGEAKALESQITLLKERQGLLISKDFAEKMAAESKNLQDAANLLSDSFSDAFTDFIDGSKSAKDAFRAFADDITRQINRLAAQKIGDAIFGGNTSAGGVDFSSLIAKLFGSYAGGGAGAVTGAAFGFAAHGSNFTSGGPYMVGERGAEVVVPPRGSQIIPNNKLGQGGNVTHIHVNVMPGATTQSAHQAAVAMGHVVRREMARG